MTLAQTPLSTEAFESLAYPVCLTLAPRIAPFKKVSWEVQCPNHPAHAFACGTALPLLFLLSGHLMSHVMGPGAVELCYGFR